MKKTGLLIAALSFLILSAPSVWAKCAPLIKEGRELLTTTKVSQAEKDKAKGLLDEAQKNLDAGDHANGVKHASAALDILKKK